LSITEYCKNKNKEYNEGIGGNSMKLGVKICKYLVILLGTFIIVMSLDSFDGTDTFWGMLLEFIMNSIPGIILIGLIILLWKQELILSILMFALAIGLFFLFRFYRNNFENWLTMLTVEIPLLAAGTMFILKHLKDKELDH
jgi:hypothetical protein